jgi:hypothetical protein
MSNRASYQNLSGIRIGGGHKVATAHANFSRPSRVASDAERGQIRNIINKLNVAANATNETELRYQLSSAFRTLRNLNLALNPPK